MTTMKLRIRPATGGASATFKVEVPPTCSLQGMEDAIAEALQSRGIPVPRPLRVSLNKKEPIQGHASSLLSQFGICNGDLLFYFERSDASVESTGGLNLGEGSIQCLKVSHAQESHREPLFRVSTTGKSVSMDSSGVDMASKDTASLRRELCAAAATRRVSVVAHQPTKVTRVETGEFTSIVDEPGPSSDVVDTSIDMVDEPGSSSNVVNTFSDMVHEPGSTSDVLDTSNDVMQIDGEMPKDMLSDSVNAGQERFSNSIPAILQRILKAEHGSVRRPSDFLLLAVHAVMLETGFVVMNDVDEGHTLPGGWSNGGVANICYTLRDMPDGVNGVGGVVLKSLTLGGNVVIYGTITGSGLPARKLSMLMSKHIIGNVISHDDPISSYSDVFELWKCAKDELSLPLLTAVCEMAGLPPPSSLLVIPTELKMKILECLPAMDLVKAGCACSELRHLSANDELWKKLFDQDFGNPSAAQKLPSFRGWKSAYAVRFLDKKRSQERRPRMDRRPHMHGPFYGIGSRYRFPIIGGDYDIYPSFGSGPYGSGFGGTRGPLGGLHGRLRNDDLGNGW